MKHSIGIVIGRMQPPHKGHKKLIDSALKQHSEVIVFLWWSGEINEQNPYSFEQRDEFLQALYPDSNLMIDYLYDTETDKQWVQSIGFQLLKLWIYNSATFYAGDLENDSAISAIKKYESELGIPEISYFEIPRDGVMVKIDGEDILVSATRVREAIQNREEDVLQAMLPKEIYHALQSSTK